MSDGTHRELVIEIPDGWRDEIVTAFGDRISNELPPGVHMVLMRAMPDTVNPAILTWTGDGE